MATYRKAVLMQAAKALRPNGFGANPIKDVINAGFQEGLDKGAAQRFQDGLRAEINGLARAKLSRQDRWIEQAEGKPVRDVDGNVIMVNGKPLLEPDHRALAAHDRNQTSDLDLLARLGQLYGDAGESQQQVTVMMSFGDVSVNVDARQQSVVIDADVADEGLVRSGNR
jgi:hypothetical protein